jgi:hypothetical protein
MPRPRCGRGLLPAEPDRASSAGRQGTNTSAPPRSVVTTSRSSPMVGQYAGTLRRPHLRGTWNTRSFPYSPPTDRHRRWTSSHGRRAASAAPQPVRIPSGSPGRSSTLVRATHGQRSTIPSRQARFGQRRPSRAPTTATRPTRCANVAGPAAPTDSGSSTVRTARLQRLWTPDACPSGHPGSPRSRGHRSPGHQTSARPVGRTSVRMADSGRGPSDDRRGRRPDILDGHDDGDRRLGGPNLARVAASAALVNP